MTREYLNPSTLPDWRNMFSQVVVSEKSGLRLIHLSGQVGVDAQKNIAGKKDLKAQTEQSFENLKMALAAAGALLSDVVKLVIYVVNYQYAHAGIIKEALQKVFPEHALPALSLIGVAALAEQDFLIEIEAEAIVETVAP